MKKKVNLHRTLLLINSMQSHKYIKSSNCVGKSILFITKFPPAIGGVASQEYWYAHTMAEKGYSVYIVTNCLEDVEGFVVDEKYDSLIKNSTQKVGKGKIITYYTSLSRFSNGTIKKKHKHIPYSNMSTTKLYSLGKSIINMASPQIIYSGYLEPYGFVAYLLSKEFNIPHVLSFAGSDISRLCSINDINSTFRNVISNASKIMTTWEKGDRLIALGACPQCISIVPKPIIMPAEFYKNKGRKEEKTIGIFGKYGKHKCTDIILKAISRFDEFTLNCMLNPNKKIEIKNKITDLNIKNVNYFPPYFPWEMGKFLTQNNIMFFFDENFDVTIHAPIAPIEAALCGVCIVLSKNLYDKMRITGLKDCYNCIVLKEITEDTIVDLLKDYIKRTEYYKSIGTNASISLKDEVNKYIFDLSIEGIETERSNSIQSFIAIHYFFKNSLSVIKSLFSYLWNLFCNEVFSLRTLNELAITIMDDDSFLKKLELIEREILLVELARIKLYYTQQELNNSIIQLSLIDNEFVSLIDPQIIESVLTITIMSISLKTSAINILFNNDLTYQVIEKPSEQKFYLICKNNFELQLVDQCYGEFLLKYNHLFKKHVNYISDDYSRCVNDEYCCFYLNL